MKKHITLILGLSLVLAFTGCADKGTETINSSGTVSDSTNSTPSAPSETVSLDTASENISGTKPPKEQSSEASNVEYALWTEHEDVTLEEAIAESNCVVRASYVSLDEFDEYVDYRFKPIELLKGEIDGEIDGEFFVRYDKDFSDDFTQIFDGGEYVLPLRYINSVYFDYPVYNVTGHIFLPCGGSGEIECVSIDQVLTQTPSNISSVSDFASYTESIADTSTVMFKDYIHSSSLDDIVSGSTYIVKAEISGEPSRTGADRGIYPCSLIQCYKGDLEQDFRAIFHYDSVEVGGEYYFFLRNDSKGKVYTISSKNSIYSSDNDDVVKALERSGLI